jgi:hypothetical protein
MAEVPCDLARNFRKDLLDRIGFGHQLQTQHSGQRGATCGGHRDRRRGRTFSSNLRIRRKLPNSPSRQQNKYPIHALFNRTRLIKSFAAIETKRETTLNIGAALRITGQGFRNGRNCSGMDGRTRRGEHVPADFLIIRKNQYADENGPISFPRSCTISLNPRRHSRLRRCL